MRASDLRIDEKRGILKRLGQTVKSLFSNEAMKDRAVAIVADQWESDWRQFMKNKATEKKEDGSVRYPAQDKQKNWIIYPDLFSEFIERKGVNAQIAKRIVGKVAPELKVGPKEIKPKDVFFNEITRSLIDADALEIEDPEGLIKRVKGDAGVERGGAQLTPDELGAEFYSEFIEWAKEFGYTIPTASETELSEADENKLTTDVVKKWLKQTHLSNANEDVIHKFDKFIDKDKTKVNTEQGLKELLKSLHFELLRNYLRDDKNNKDRSEEDFQKIVDIAIVHYKEKKDDQMVNALRSSSELTGAFQTFQDNKERLIKDGFDMNPKTGAINAPVGLEEPKDLLTRKERRDAIDWLKLWDVKKSKDVIDELEAEDIQDIGPGDQRAKEIAQVAMDKDKAGSPPPKEKPEEKPEVTAPERPEVTAPERPEVTAPEKPEITSPEEKPASEEESEFINPKVKQKAAAIISKGGFMGFKQAGVEIDALEANDLKDDSPNDPNYPTAVATAAIQKWQNKRVGKTGTVKDAAKEFVDSAKEAGHNEEPAEVAFTKAINDDPEITDPETLIEPQEKEELGRAALDNLEDIDEHKQISDIIRNNYLVHDRLDPTNHLHMMYYYLADLLGSEEGDEKGREDEK